VGHLVLVRHAPTEASQEGRNLGRASDPPLSADGLRLADRLAKVLAVEMRDLPAGDRRLLTSPALRCRQTAEAIATALPGIAHTEVYGELVEISYGAWDGLTAAECAARDPELRAAWEADPYATRTPGGESGGDVASRAFPILDGVRDWLAEEPGRAAVVVAHNHVNRLWLTALMGWPMADYRRRISQDPAGYSIIEYGLAAPMLRRLNAVPPT
jgi:broad specificity phosphatase PhoE